MICGSGLMDCEKDQERSHFGQGLLVAVPVAL